jgi:TorA maturation chaperone TorD
VLAVGLEEPDGELVAVLRSGELVAQVEDALGVLWRDEADATAVTGGLREATNAARHEGAGEVLGDLRTEYARLFTGPGSTAVAGFESQWASGCGETSAPLFGPVATAVAEFYAREGVQASAGLPADRAATEVEFLFHLSMRESSAWQEGDVGEARRLRAVREQFVGAHAGAWLPLLGDDLGTAARCRLYVGLATLLGSFVRAEAGAAHAPAEGDRCWTD